MGRPGLSQNKKFRRLALELKSPAIARGHLELMWDSAYEAGDEVLGDCLDVELAASWKGKTGILCDLLTKTGFIEEADGTYTIHDFWHHAPAYVRKRRTRENERRSKIDPCSSSDQAVTSQGRDIDDKTAPLPHPHPHPHPKETTPTPSGPGESSEKPKRKRRTKEEILGPFPESVRLVVNTLLGQWRKEDPEDGRPIVASPEDFGKAVDRILKAQPNVTAEDLIQSAIDYLASKRGRYKAPQYFFGPDGPWDGFVRAAMTRRQTRNVEPLQVTA